MYIKSSPNKCLRHFTRNTIMKYSSLFPFSRVLTAAALICCTASGLIRPTFADQTVELKGDSGGKRFDGIGAVSGGGATSVLLKDYPESQRNQILDLLFKPKFGASMSALLVEVPGDGNATQGSESSHMHTKGDLNFSRGYEWWLMSEAKKRNPALTLDACAWGCPAWVGNGNFWSQDMCDYYVKWIQGLKSVYGLNLDAIGCRNEKGVNLDFVKQFRVSLDANGLKKVDIHGFDNWDRTKFDFVRRMTNDLALRNAVAIISAHTMATSPTPPDVLNIAETFGKPIWNSEEHVYKKGFDCEISLVQAFNQNFLVSGVTKIVNWYLVGSVYPMESFSEEPPAMIANSPWSGHYNTREVLWGYAHYGQFSKIGWQYLNGACGKLADGPAKITASFLKPRVPRLFRTSPLTSAAACVPASFVCGAVTLKNSSSNKPTSNPSKDHLQSGLSRTPFIPFPPPPASKRVRSPTFLLTLNFHFRFTKLLKNTHRRKNLATSHITQRTSPAFSKLPIARTGLENASARLSIKCRKAGLLNGCLTRSSATSTGRITKSAPISTWTTAAGRGSWVASTMSATAMVAPPKDTICG
jgi:hypothetical protein